MLFPNFLFEILSYKYAIDRDCVCVKMKGKREITILFHSSFFTILETIFSSFIVLAMTIEYISYIVKWNSGRQGFRIKCLGTKV